MGKINAYLSSSCARNSWVLVRFVDISYNLNDGFFFCVRRVKVTSSSRFIHVLGSDKAVDNIF